MNNSPTKSKKKLMFADQLEMPADDTHRKDDDYDSMHDDSMKMETQQFSESQSPTKRRSLIKRPSMMTEQEIIEEQSVKITKENYIRHIDQSQIQVESKVTLGESDTKVFCMKFDEEDKYIAAACENGQVRVYNAITEKLSYVLANENESPMSYVKWRPMSGNNKTRNVFVTTNADGQIQHWHLNSGKCIDTIQVQGDLDNQLYCLDFNNDGSKFAVCGAEPTIRLYDENKKTQIQEMNGHNSDMGGHGSRVYCIKFDREDPNVLVSGGWDKQVILWDIRTSKSQKIIVGPFVCGDGIDIYKNNILTASWREENQLQLWNLSTCKLITNLSWQSQKDNLQSSIDPTYLYSCQFSKQEGSLILTGGSNVNEVRLFDTLKDMDPFCSIYNLPREIYTMDFGNKGTSFAISGGDGLVRIFKTNIIA